jgi:hypothetical protein
VRPAGRVVKWDERRVQSRVRRIVAQMVQAGTGQGEMAPFLDTAVQNPPPRHGDTENSNVLNVLNVSDVSNVILRIACCWRSSGSMHFVPRMQRSLVRKASAVR